MRYIILTKYRILYAVDTMFADRYFVGNINAAYIISKLRVLIYVNAGPEMPAHRMQPW